MAETEVDDDAEFDDRASPTSIASPELRFEAKGGDTLVFGDVNGDGKADFSIRFDDALVFVKGDFIL